METERERSYIYRSVAPEQTATIGINVGGFDHL